MKAYALLAALVVTSIAPFASRAVSIDEHIFLRLARSALVHPLFPADTPAIFFGIERASYIGHTHPPVGEYYLAALYVLLGEFDETAFRLLFAVFPVAAILAFYALAKRFSAEPLLLSALLAVSPAFFVSAPTVMMDIPMLAFLLAGLAFYFNGHLVPAALSFILAVGTGYTAMVPIACLGLIMLISRRPPKELACVAVAPAALALWLLAMTIHFGEFPLKQTTEYLVLQGVTAKSAFQLIGGRADSIYLNLLATLSFLGGVSIFPGCVRLTKTRSWLASIGLATVLSVFVPAPSLLYRIWFIVLATCGLMLVAAFAGSASRIIKSASKDGGEAVLILWVPAVLVFFVVVGETINARYLLLALPALYLIVFRESSRSALIGIIIPTALLSLILAYADARFVNSYRTWVTNTIPPIKQQGFRVYSAAESGLRFYLESEGAETLSQTDIRPLGGDLIVRQEMYSIGLAKDVGDVSTVLKRFVLTDSFPVRTFSPTAGAGFYGRQFGMVPFVISSLPYDEIEVQQINPLVQHLPQASTDPEQTAVWSPDGPIFKQADKEREFPMKIPSGIQIQYEIEGGTGVVEETAGGLRLVNTAGTTITWRRLRFTPSQFLENKE